MSTLEEKIAVMQAASHGAKIECLPTPSASGITADWRECPKPVWNWAYWEYRVAKTQDDYTNAALKIYYYNSPRAAVGGAEAMRKVIDAVKRGEIQ